MSLDDRNINPLESDGEDTFSAFEQVNQKEPAKPKKKLKKRTLTILLTSGLALLLAGALLMLLLFPPSTEPEPDDSDDTPGADTSVTLLDKTEKGKTVIQQIDVKNTKDSYSLYFDKKDKKFLLKGYEDILLNSSLTDTLVSCTTSLVATDQVKDPQKLKDYGLDKPDATVNITYADKSTAQLSIGSPTPSEDGYYVTCDVKEGVYIFSADTTSIFTYHSVAYADTTLITTPAVKSSDENGTAVLKEVSYTGSNYPTPMTVRRSYHTDSEELTLFTYIIEKPFLRGTSDAVINELSAFKSLSARQALILHPTKQEKTKLGFDDPLAVMKITMAVESSNGTSEDEETIIKTYYNETTTTITIGSIDAGYYVVMMDGIDAIFVVDQSAFSSIADRTYDNTVIPLLFLKNITEIGRMVITIDGETSDFVLTHYPEKEDTDKQMKVTVGDKKYSTSDFRELYQLLMGLERFDILDQDPDGDPFMEVSMYTTSGEFYLGAKYYPLTGSLCAVKTTEGEVFTTRWHNVTHFTDQVENYLNGDKVLMLT